jgi:hypothetical protein
MRYHVSYFDLCDKNAISLKRTRVLGSIIGKHEMLIFKQHLLFYYTISILIFKINEHHTVQKKCNIVQPEDGPEGLKCVMVDNKG